ncbi:unnamed protein product [Linum trigynum]|uniref:Retroviral polymerase SH3-like domain-containing protein n=1 Tax=Linum trigynum TaxID=586398 RepID=A0AAV2DUD7_9ROSI
MSCVETPQQNARVERKHQENKTPYEIQYGHPPDVSNLKVFGWLCYARTLSHNKTKFSPRAKPCIFMGFPPGVKGYKLFDLQGQNVFFSRDVVFRENIIPCLSTDSSPPCTSTSQVPYTFISPTTEPFPTQSSPLDPEPLPNPNTSSPTPESPVPTSPQPLSPDSSPSSSSSN